MCGITGWANLDARTPPPEGAKELLHSMCERMIHRGPDSKGLFVSTGVALGMRRLAIIDLVTGEQPVSTKTRVSPSSSTAKSTTTANCAHDLEKRGHSFRSASDTEVSAASLRRVRRRDGPASQRHVCVCSVGRASDAGCSSRAIVLAKSRSTGASSTTTLLFASEPKVLLAHPARAAGAESTGAAPVPFV